MTENQLRRGGWGQTYDFIDRQASQRKRMLAFCACCRCTWDHVRLECNRAAIEASERFADGEIGLRELEDRWRQTRFEPVVYTHWMLAASGPLHKKWEFAQLSLNTDADHAALAAFQPLRNERSDGWTADWIACSLDVFGNVFRQVRPVSAWGTTDVLALARQMYASRDFSAMPILADALQDAGCDSVDVLDHCRDASQKHVRGCWVVDLLLGKE